MFNLIYTKSYSQLRNFYYRSIFTVQVVFPLKVFWQTLARIDLLCLWRWWPAFVF